MRKLIAIIFTFISVVAFAQTSTDGSLSYINAEVSFSSAASFFPYPDLNPANRRNVVKISDKVYKVTAWPQAGYNYDYYIYIPASYATLKPTKILAISIASGGAQGMGPEYYSEWAMNVVVKGNWETKIADNLGTPLVYPAFDRPANGSAASLTRDAMLIKNDRISRLDLQFIAMIDDAKEFLFDEFDMLFDSKFLMAGYSMSGSFAMRFTFMHPELVQAVVYGGSSCWHMLPYSTAGSTQLIYPVGVSDLESITGKDFDRDAYLSVPKFYFEGEIDSDDIIMFGGLFPRSMLSWFNDYFGSDLTNRWSNMVKVISGGNNIKMARYSDIGHWVNLSEVIKFLKLYIK